MKGQRRMMGFLLVGLALITVLQPHNGRAAALKPCWGVLGFNGDQCGDLVVGVPYESIGSEAHAGAVQVLYGASGGGLSATGSQLWHQDVSGVLDTAEADDEFGYALAVGDLNGDGYLDLAVGVHGESVGNPPIATAGAVQVFYGSASGLGAGGNQLWHQDVAGIQDQAETDDRFGFSLAAGDFDGDGYADLAVGVVWEDVGSPAVVDAGAVQVLYGSANGLTAVGNQLWYQGVNGVQGTPQANDWFGRTLSAGDFDGDGYADLAVGVSLEDVGGVVDAGAVQILYGSASGLTGARDQVWHQDVNGVVDSAETSDEFGYALAAGDANGDGFDDLAVGIPYEDVGTPAVVDAGAVHIFYGSASGLTANDDWLLHQDNPGVVDAAETGDMFGWALAGGDFNGDGTVDLAVGVRREDVGSPAVVDAGAVHVLYSQTGGLNELWYQGKNGLVDTPGTGDQFGYALAAGDFDGDGYADVVVGVPGEDVGTPAVVDAGAVEVLYGAPNGLTANGSQMWHQGVSGIQGTAETNDRFGYSLAAIAPVRHHVYLPMILRKDRS